MSLGPTHRLRIKFANSLEFFTLYEFSKKAKQFCTKFGKITSRQIYKRIHKQLKAYKENSTVIMDSSTYDFKVKDLLTNDSVYKQLPDKPNSLNAVVQRVIKFVCQLRKNDKISQSYYFDLRSNKGVMPRFYGLP